MTERASFEGQVTDAGRIVVDDRERLRSALQRLRGKRVVMHLSRPKRSSKQNSWYWACIVPAVADYLSTGRTVPLSGDQAHEVLKAAFIGVEQTELGAVPRSSAALSIEEFSDYCERIRAHAATEWRLQIPGPGESAC